MQRFPSNPFVHKLVAISALATCRQVVGPTDSILYNVRFDIYVFHACCGFSNRVGKISEFDQGNNLFFCHV